MIECSSRRRLFRSVLPTCALVLVLVLTGCWGGGDAPPPRQSTISRFVQGSQDEILTTIVDPLPVKTAELRQPDGQAIAAYRIDKDRSTYAEEGGYGTGVGVGVAGGSGGVTSTGIGIGFPLFGGGGGGTRTHSTTTSTLHFKLPDMEAYRRDWQRWVLHVELDDGVNRRTIETLPPAPPRE